MADDTTVRVIVRAVTEAAEQAIDDVGDEMAMLGDDAAVGQTAMDQLSDEMGEATGQSAVLQRALDQLDDEIGDVGRSSLYAQTAMDQLSDEMTETTGKAAALSGAMTGLQGALSGSAAGSYALTAAFYLSLIPAAATLASVLVPMVTALVGLAGGALALAGAFGAIVGSGILAFGKQKAEQNKEELNQTKRLIAQYEQLKKQTGSLSRREKSRLEQLRNKKKQLEDTTGVMGALKREMAKLADEIVPLIRQFGKGFIPLIERALAAVPDLVEAMLNSVGGTEEFEKALGDLGTAMMKVLPALTGWMFELARDALPLAREFFRWLMNNGGDIWDAIQDSMEELEPEFRNLIDAIIEASPELLEFGENVSKEVLPVITDFIEVADDLMESINEMDKGTRKWTIRLLALAPVLLWVIGKITTLTALLLGKGGLAAGLGRVAQALGGGGGAAATAGVYGAAIAVGAGLGYMGLKALDAMGAFEKLKEESKKLRDQLGGENVDAALNMANVASGGGLEMFSKFGVTALDVARGEGDLGADERRRIEETFSAGTPQEAAQDVVTNDVNIDVDARGHVQRDPYQWSRDAAYQLDRETRKKHGTGN